MDDDLRRMVPVAIIACTIGILIGVFLENQLMKKKAVAHGAAEFYTSGNKVVFRFKRLP